MNTKQTYDRALSEAHSMFIALNIAVLISNQKGAAEKRQVKSGHPE